ncbi:MAG: cbb3-type cytochrome c oxidase subunit I [Candidatus Thermoplasmatota archaeon]|nr:cbb3-type cytochrome c oxidase subunit I [Candidatus Thermoplasmatota archaeon]
MGNYATSPSQSRLLKAMKRWLFTTNHKDVGVLYLITSLAFFFVGGSFALLMRTQLYYPGNTFLNAYYYNQLVTSHGLIMVFWFISAFAFAFANYVVPIQIGAKDMAFPRLNALSYWLYLFSGILFLSGFLMPGGTIAGGWTIYQPLNTLKYSPQLGEDAAILGLIMLCVSVIVSTVNFAVTITMKRAKGYGWLDLPMFTISIMFTIMMMWLAFPVVATDLILLFVSRTVGGSVLTSEAGGALLWQHLFWFFGHPEVYIVFLPALGMMYDISSVFSGMPIYTKKVMIATFAAETLLSLTVYMHHMFMTGTNLFWLDVSSVNTLTIGIPAGVLVLGELTTKIDGTFRPETPALFTVGAVIAFIIGGASGVFLSSITLDSGFNGGYWVVAHFHYIFVGTILFGIYAGLYYWFPKMFGRMYSERLGKIHFVASFIGLNLLYFPMFALFNMPRRYYTYPSGLGFTLPNQLATIGSYVFGFAQLIIVANLIYSYRHGSTATENPWNSWSYEWLIPSPPPEFNFDGTTMVKDGRLLILPPDRHQMHTGEHAGSHLSPWPFSISLGTFLTLLGLTLDVGGFGNGLLAIGLMLFLISAFGWMIDDYYDAFPVVEKDGDGGKETWPFRDMDSRRLGMWVFLTGDLFVFMTLINSTMFLDLQVSFFHLDPPSPLENFANFSIAALVLFASIFSMYAAVWGARNRKRQTLAAGLIMTIVFAVIYIGTLYSDWSSLSSAGKGFGAMATSPLLSAFYDAGMIHLAHLVAGIAILAYFAVKAMNGNFFRSAGTRSSLVAFFYFWVMIAVAGILFTGVFAMV